MDDKSSRSFSKSGRSSSIIKADTEKMLALRSCESTGAMYLPKFTCLDKLLVTLRE